MAVAAREEMGSGVFVRQTGRLRTTLIYRLKIEGMSCKNCAIRIENAFNEQEGFYAKVDLGKKSALIRLKVPAAEEMLEQTVSRAGYQVTELEQLTP